MAAYDDMVDAVTPCCECVLAHRVGVEAAPGLLCLLS